MEYPFLANQSLSAFATVTVLSLGWIFCAKRGGRYYPQDVDQRVDVTAWDIYVGGLRDRSAGRRSIMRHGLPTQNKDW